MAESTALYMVIERFQDPDAVRRRFAEQGRMLPEGVHYINSWVTEDRSTCYQIMEAPSESALDAWIAKWNDIVDFEVVPVMTSAQFAEQRES